MRPFFLSPERTAVVIWVWRTPKFVFFTFCMWRSSALGKLLPGLWFFGWMMDDQPTFWPVVSNWYHFFQILARGPFQVMLLEMSFLDLNWDWPPMDQTGHFTTSGFGLLTALDILEWANLPHGPYNLSVQQYAPDTWAHLHMYHLPTLHPISPAPRLPAPGFSLPLLFLPLPLSLWPAHAGRGRGLVSVHISCPPATHIHTRSPAKTLLVCDFADNTIHQISELIQASWRIERPKQFCTSARGIWTCSLSRLLIYSIQKVPCNYLGKTELMFLAAPKGHSNISKSLSKELKNPLRTV